MNAELFLFDYLKRFNSQNICPVFKVLKDNELEFISVKTDRGTAYLLFDIKIQKEEGKKIFGVVDEILFHHEKCDPFPVNCMSLTFWCRGTKVILDFSDEEATMAARH